MSSLPPGRRERRFALATVLISAVIFAALAPFAGQAACAGLGVHSRVPVGDRRQRHGDRRPAARPVRDPAPAAAARARGRLPVHGFHGRHPHADLSRTVRTDRPARRRRPDHRLAVPVLARRLSAGGRHLRAAAREVACAGADPGPAATRGDSDRAVHRGRGRRDGRARAARDGRPRPAAAHHERQPDGRDDDERDHDRLGAEPGSR